MGCRSDYMDPSQEERNKKETSELIVFVDKKLGIKTPKHIKESAEHVYGEGALLDETVPMLCSKLTALTKKQEDEIVYNGRDAMSRKLAEWWDEHKAADVKRIKKEKEEKAKAKAAKAALAKLTPKEKKILGLK